MYHDKTQTYSSFKEWFYSSFPDLSIFNFNNYNLFKVVIGGLRSNFTFSTYFANHLLYLYFAPIYNRIRLSPRRPSWPLKFASQKELLIIDSGRYIEENDSSKSIYFYNIIKLLQEHKISHYLISKKTYPDTIDNKADLDFSEALKITKSKFCTKQERDIYYAIIAIIKTIKKSNLTQDQIRSITCNLQLFFEEFRVWNYVLDSICPRKILFICHYYNEGLILSAKIKGVPTIELQHGLISTVDLFYNFPESAFPILSKSLFPDKILTYGEYWNSVLEKGGVHLASRITDVGFSQYTPPTNLDSQELLGFIKNKKVLLITTQVSLAAIWINYISWLANDCISLELDAAIVVKIHPAEKKDEYIELRKWDNVRIIDDISLHKLIPISNIHMTIYSTSIFDSIRMGQLNNYSLFTELCEDYVTELSAIGVCEVIQEKQNPFLLKEKQNEIKKELFYTDFSEYGFLKSLQ